MITLSFSAPTVSQMTTLQKVLLHQQQTHHVRQTTTEAQHDSVCYVPNEHILGER